MVPICTCGRTFKHSQVTSTYVARKYLDDFNKNLDWAIFGLKHQVMQDVSVDLSINQLYRAKRKAKEFILGDKRLQYGKLRDYAEMIRLGNFLCEALSYARCVCGLEHRSIV